MKALSFLCVLGCVLLSTQSAQAYSNSHFISSIIKSNQTARSKPTYTKYAAVSFLKSTDVSVDFKGSLDVKSQCGALGYVIKVDSCNSKTGKLNGVSGNYFKPSKLCSDDDSIKAADKEEAKKYTTGCCDSRIYTVEENEECPYNAAKLSNDACYWGGKNKYRCACDRGRYQYSTIKGEQCGATFDSFNVNLACYAYEPRTEKSEMYFISCCPSSYSVCNDKNHEVGRGNECRVADSKANLALAVATPALKEKYIYSKFEECPCAQHYDTICSDGQIIDPDNVCKKNGLNYTADVNCESKCTKTIETNVDDYLHERIWHCLFEPDGATIKRQEGPLCDRPETIEMQGYARKDFYTNCEAQGFNKSEADCYNQSVMLRCPTNNAKVWCIESKYCTGFDVGGDDNCDTSKADVMLCPSMNLSSPRCKYKNNACNEGWTEGVLTSDPMTLTASETILNDKGMLNTCCKEGYKFENGKCVANVCSEITYPYSNNPGTEPGKRIECSAADPDKPTGYTKHYGYEDCYTEDNTEFGQGMWKRKSDNPSTADYHKCVCERNSATKVGLPFDVSDYYEQNTAAPYGFNKGSYGHSVSCTDDEGSYYGYTDCYIAYKPGTGDNKYKCLQAETAGFGSVYPYYSIDMVNTFLSQNNIAPYSISTPNSNPRTSAQAFCVNRYTHYEDRQGNKLGDDSVLPFLVEGCNTGTESYCNECYHVSNLVKEDGLWKARGTFKLIANRNTTYGLQYGFTACPEGFIHGGSNSRNYCFKYCYAPDFSTCAKNDVLKKGDTIVGIVLRKTGNLLDVTSIKRAYKTYEEALEYAATFAPAGLEEDPIFGKGKWHMPGAISETNSDCDHSWRKISTQVGGHEINETWYYGIKVTEDGKYASSVSRCASSSLKPITSKSYIVPMLRVDY